MTSGDESIKWRPPQYVRPIAVGIVWSGDKLLLDAVCEDDGTIAGWRPLGGTIEFGESAGNAVEREFLVELGESVTVMNLITVMENHYEHNGAKGHEIVFVFEAKFSNQEVYDLDVVQRIEAGSPVPAEWVPISSLSDDEATIFPVGLLKALAKR